MHERIHRDHHAFSGKPHDQCMVLESPMISPLGSYIQFWYTSQHHMTSMHRGVTIMHAFGVKTGGGILEDTGVFQKGTIEPSRGEIMHLRRVFWKSSEEASFSVEEPTITCSGRGHLSSRRFRKAAFCQRGQERNHRAILEGAEGISDSSIRSPFPFAGFPFFQEGRSHSHLRFLVSACIFPPYFRRHLCTVTGNRFSAITVFLSISHHTPTALVCSSVRESRLYTCTISAPHLHGRTAITDILIVYIF